MPRFNVEYKGQWACFSSVSDSFITTFGDRASYEKWRIAEYGKNCDPTEKSNSATMEQAVFSMRLNRSREKALQLLLECGLTEKDSVELLDAVDEKYFCPTPIGNGKYECPNCGTVVEENQNVCNDEHCCLNFVWKKN